MARLIATLLLLLPSIAGAVDYATITGTLLKPSGAPCASCTVKFRTPYEQTIGGTTFPVGPITTAIANSSGVLPAGTQVARTLVVEVTIGSGQPKLCEIADAATVDISTCVGSVPSPADINDIPGILDPPSGGTGSGIIASCDADDEKLETSAAGVFSCGANPGGGGGGAPTDATYLVRTANGTLSAEFAMGSLGTGLVLNTTTTGTPSIYMGTSCTNQFPRSLNASGAATCADVTLGTDTAGSYAAGDGEAGAALTGDSATAFFSTGLLGQAIGGTGADMSVTGGTGHVVKQTSVGGALVTGVLISNNFAANAVDANAIGPNAVQASELDSTDTSLRDELEGVLRHAQIQGITTGDAGHTQFALLAGRSGGQTLIGGTGAGDDLTLQTTSNGSKGSYIFSELVGCDADNEKLELDGTGVLGCGSNPGGGGGTSLSVDGGSALPTADLDDGGDVNFTESSGTITAAITVDWALGDGVGGNAIFPGVGDCTGIFDKVEIDNLGNVSCDPNGNVRVLDDLNDVAITAVASGDFLRHNGSDWVDATISDGDVPNNITIDLATLATTATTANAGDSATAFFSEGTIEATRLPNADDDASTKGVVTFADAEFDCTTGSCVLATGGVTATHLAADSVGSSELANGAIDEIAAALDGTGLLVDTSTTPDEIDVDTTEITGNRTWGNGSDASITWTFDLSGNDVLVSAANDGSLELLPSLSTIGAATATGLKIDPSITMTASSSALIGYQFAPVIDVSVGTAPTVAGVRIATEVLASAANTLSAIDGIDILTTSEADTAAIPPFPMHNIRSNPTLVATAGSSIGSSLTTSYQADQMISADGGNITYADPNQVDRKEINAIDAAANNFTTASAHGYTTGDGPFYIADGDKECVANDDPFNPECSGAQTGTGALPTGITARTSYWVIVVDADQFEVATSYADAIAGTEVDFSGGTAALVIGPAGTGLAGLRVTQYVSTTGASDEARVDSLFGAVFRSPSIGGSGTEDIGRLGAIYIEEQAHAAVDTPCAICSVGPGSPLKFAGKARFGDYQDASPTATLEVEGHAALEDTLSVGTDLTAVTLPTNSTTGIIEFDASFSATGGSVGSQAWVHWNPAITIGSAASTVASLAAVKSTGSITTDSTTATETQLPAGQLLWDDTDYIVGINAGFPAPSQSFVDTTNRYAGSGVSSTTANNDHFTVLASPTTSSRSGGTLNFGDMVGLRFTPTVMTDFGTDDGSAASADLTLAVDVVNPSSSGAGTETIDLAGGIRIARLSNAAIAAHFGIRNSDTTEFVPCTDTITAGETITPACSTIEMSSAGAVTCSTSTCISDGNNGQIITLVNAGANPITIDGTGANVALHGAADLALGTGDTLTLQFFSVAGLNNWYEITSANN